MTQNQVQSFFVMKGIEVSEVTAVNYMELEIAEIIHKML